tara:strand:- start:561 stop:770 length:210 start_codon:yes stop_codon:yes gene_type:complete
MFNKKKEEVETKKEAKKKTTKVKEEKPKEKDYSWVSYFATDITDDLKKLDSRVRQLELKLNKVMERMGL